MIDPSKISNFNLTDYELEENMMFWVLAAGKNGRTAAKCLNKLLLLISGAEETPLESVTKIKIDTLAFFMKTVGIGCFNNKAKTLNELANKVLNENLNLRTCAAGELESIYGIGMKTSRCFILHTRRGARYAGLDTHLLKFLRREGVENVPKHTPGSKKEYLRLENEFLKIADKLKKEPFALDLEVWNYYSK